MFQVHISRASYKSPQNVARTDARSFAAPEFIAVVPLNAYSTQIANILYCTAFRWKYKTRHISFGWIY